MTRQISTARIITALKKKKGLVYLAAKSIGCTPQAIYHRMKEEPEVKQAVEDARGQVVDVAEEKLFAAVQGKQPWAIGMVLRTLGKDRGYVERSESRFGGDKDAPPITTKDDSVPLDKLPLALKIQILEALEAADREEEERRNVSSVENRT